MSEAAASAVAEIPPSDYPYLPALIPPPGEQINFQNPEDRRTVLFVVSTVFLSFMVMFFVARIYAKAFILKRARWDDLTCSMAVLGSIATYIVTTWGCLKGPIGKHQWNVTLAEVVSNNFTYPSYITIVTAPPTLGFVKLTLCILYLQIFWPMRWVRIAIYIGATSLVLFYGTATTLQFIFSTPRPGQTMFEHLASSEEGSAITLGVAMAAFGLVIDIHLIVVPLVAVAQSHLPTRRKIGVGLIFLTGLLAFVASLLSLYYRVVLWKSQDDTWNLVDVEMMAVMEMYVGIIVSCMPSASQVARRHLPAFDGLRSRLSSRISILRNRRKEDAMRLSSGQSESRAPQISTLQFPQSKEWSLFGSAGNTRFSMMNSNA